MPIIRAPRPQTHFYVLDKAVSEDKRLSWAARGLLIFLLGKPDHWRVSVPALVSETAEATKSTGRDAVYTLLSELISAGYVRRDKHSDGTIDYTVCEPDPENPDVAGEPVPENPDPENPDPENPDPEKPDVLVSTGKAVRTEKAANGRGQFETGKADDSFKRFWATWPATDRRVAKAKCAEKWDKAGLSAEVEIILAHVESMKATNRLWQTGYEPAPLTYLNQRRWEDCDGTDAPENVFAEAL